MNGKGPSVLWFRHGLRLHDNEALLKALEICRGGNQFLAIFIFDGESAGTKLVGYNRMKFLLESLADLNNQLRRHGGQLLLLKGKSSFVFRRLWEEMGISTICFEQDCENIWRERDDAVKLVCRELGIRCHEKISHTLWNPREIIEMNGGVPPLTYQMFLHTVDCLGPPARPVPVADFRRISFATLPTYLHKELALSKLDSFPVPEDFGIKRLSTGPCYNLWKGGETAALESLGNRLNIEGAAFSRGDYMPNQMCPNLTGSPTALSVYLRFGCLSVRKFYYAIHDRFLVSAGGEVGGPHITGQLIWREYFYTMSVDNPFYDRILDNPICLKIPWTKLDVEQFQRWKDGQTGFPLIDAAMRQLLAEGWLHHTLRNAVATFLTRGGLWFSWEHGFRFFLEHLLDADWSVCAGNWMWISSSAFEQLLDSSKCTSPVALARRLDPRGEYLIRYIPELGRLPIKYRHQPWLTPKDVQISVGCVIGEHYPAPMIDLVMAGERNSNAMKKIRQEVLQQSKNTEKREGCPAHCRPSNDEEICTFFWLNEESKLKQKAIAAN